ncbi:replication initiation factor domain-containing protein [Vreelandella sp. TE19]
MAFCDHLAVTFHPKRNPVGSLRSLLSDMGAVPLDDRTFRLGEGSVKLYETYGVLYCSASGAALAQMRELGVFMDWLSVISDWPHRVTRLDAAHDVLVDAADVLDALRSQYPTGQVNLGRKALRVKLELAIRDDGRETGTFYVGHRSKARATARVYDKRQERLDRAGVTGPHRTRYEVTVKQDYGATLRDAAQPDRLFWHVASPALLEAPPGTPPWTADWSQGWRFDRPERSAFEVFERRLSQSPELDLLVELADAVGPVGRVLLARRVLGRLGFSCDLPLQNVSELDLERSEG